MPSSLNAWPRWKRILVVVGLLFAVTVATVGISLFRLVHTVIPESYNAWTSGYLVVGYLQTHTNQWPRSWEELADATNYHQPQSVFVPLARLRQSVKIDWAADVTQLQHIAVSNIHADIRIVTRLDGSRLSAAVGPDTEPNWKILNYLRTIAATNQPARTLSLGASTDQSVAWIAANFTHFQRLTKKAAFVNPDLAALCRGVSKEEIEAAKMRFGLHAGTAIHIYMDDLAATSFRTNDAKFPVGAVVVKQKLFYSFPDPSEEDMHGGANGVGGMVKRAPGYDPEHGDWEYFYFETPAKIDSGRIASCVQCHEAAKGTDHVFGTWRDQISPTPAAGH